MRFLAIATLLATCAAASAAPIAIVAYDMPDGANNGWYNDQAYTGAKSGGYLSGGTGDLTDGIWNVSVAAGYAAWTPLVLWESGAPQITIDLGGLHAVNSFVTYFKSYPTAGVSLPSQVGLEYSIDKTTWTPLTTRVMTPSETNLANNVSANYEMLSESFTGRYLRATYTRANQWLALEEIRVSGAPVPEPASMAILGLGLAALRRRRR